MKRIIALILALFIFCNLTACAAVSDDDGKTYLEIKLEESGFGVVEQMGRFSDTYIYLIYDMETKAEYIFIDGYESYALSPYYDKNGNVAYYKGD
jgi:hypothetical protein